MSKYPLIAYTKGGSRVNIICGECEKKLKIGKCGFVNSEYESIFLIFCPYCGKIGIFVLPETIEELPGLQDLAEVKMPEKLLQKRRDRIIEQVRAKMRKDNDEAVEFMLKWKEGKKKFFEKEEKSEDKDPDKRR